MRRLLPVLCVVALGCNDTTIGTRNTAPAVAILAPADGASYVVGSSIQLGGRVSDSGAAFSELEVIWSSSLDAVIYEGPPGDQGYTDVLWTDPSVGEHTITLRGTDPQGSTTTEAIVLTVTQDLAPTCVISVPSNGAAVPAEAAVVLQGLVDDDVTDPADLDVRWDSSLDGLLGSLPASSDGVVSQSSNLTAGTHTITLTASDDADQDCAASITIVVNERPSAPVPRIDPTAPTIADTLVASLVFPSEDPEGDAVDYLWKWREDGTERTEYTEHFVPATEMDRGEEWSVEVRGVDSHGAVSEPGVATVTVANAPPTEPQVEVTPSDPNQAQDLVCAVTAASSDPDGDAVTYSYAWHLAGTPSGHTGATLSFLHTAPGQSWTCVATPSDGVLAGPPGFDTVAVVEGCSAYEGDGSGTVGVVLDDPALRLASGPFTLEAWVQIDAFTSNTDDVALLSKRGAGSGNGWHLGVKTTGEPFFAVSVGDDPTLVANDPLVVGDWHHVALTWDATSGLATFWIDGALSGTATLPPPAATATEDLRIGDDANLTGRVLDGRLDDVRVSSSVRYSVPFLPPITTGSDANTLALWPFEAGAGGTAQDFSGHWHTVAMAGAWSSTSSCDLDLAPSTPDVSLNLGYPTPDEDLICALDVPSVDPEGMSVTYSGLWRVDGAPSGLTFSSFPATLDAGETAEGERWECVVTASDGVRDSDEGTAAVWVGAEPVCALEVTTPSVGASLGCSFTAPVAGVLRFTMSNPDGSADGTFEIDAGTLGKTFLFTGLRDWCYGGDTIEGQTTLDAEMNLDPSDGTVALALEYDPAAGSVNNGTDSLGIDFVYHRTLSTAGATNLMNHHVGNSDAQTPNWNPESAQATIGADQRLLVQVTQCGSAGFGGHGLYIDDNGQPNDDGLLKIQTGEQQTCAKPLRSYSVPAGAYSWFLSHEDDFWVDNSGDRALSLFLYTP